MQNKRTFASRFFELLRASLSMCAFKKEERSVLISVTLMTGIAGHNTVPTIFLLQNIIKHIFLA